MLNKKVSLMAGAFALTASVGAQGAVTLTMNTAPATDQAGDQIDSVVAAVIDLDGDGWNGNSYTASTPAEGGNASSFLWDEDDQLLDVVGVSKDEPATQLSAAGTKVGPEYDGGLDNPDADHWYGIWFNLPISAADSAEPGDGAAYDAIDLGRVPTNPAGNQNVNVGFGTEPSPNAPQMEFETRQIPEPASGVLALVGGSMMLLGRGRNRNRA
jgi:hypothetical protein